MNRAKIIDRKLTMDFVTNEIKDDFKLYLLVVWSKDTVTPRSLSSAVAFLVVPTRMTMGSGQ